MKKIFPIFTLLTLFCVGTFAQQKNIELSFCKLSLSEDVKQSNITFTNRYYFKIDGKGIPLKISRISGFKFINDREIENCISAWKFENFAKNSYFIIEFIWEHGVGWHPMKIRGKNYFKAVKPS